MGSILGSATCFSPSEIDPRVSPGVFNYQISMFVVQQTVAVPTDLTKHQIILASTFKGTTMRNAQWIWLPVAAVSTSVYATSYLTVEQAQEAIFSAAKITPAFITLSVEQAKRIAKMADVDVRNRKVKAWKVNGGGWFLVDEVIGKHDLITYAVGLNADGSVKQIEVMDYRESYGYEIRNEAWRKQFVGKTSADPVTLNQDIRNISGATLSSRHVTDGVRRVLATYAVALK